jgi:hypothetical protein
MMSLRHKQGSRFAAETTAAAAYLCPEGGRQVVLALNPAIFDSGPPGS